MTSREIVKRCIEFSDPPRIALDFCTSPINGRVWPFTDFASVCYGPDPNFVPKEKGETEWGYAMTTLDPTGENMGEVKNPPLQEGWYRLKGYRLPDFENPARYEGLAEQVSTLHGQGKYVYGPIQPLMGIPISLRGMANWFVDNIDEQDNLCFLLDEIVRMNLAIIGYYAGSGVDGVITWDDMGTAERVLVGPDIFRKIYLPRYKKIADALHERGMHFIHHCCGYIRGYMDFFLEGGCDVLQLDQPELMGIDWLSEKYGGKICFWNPVDIQKTMPKGDTKAIEEEAHRQVWLLGNFAGGFMVKAYQQPNAVGITAAAAETQYRAFMKYSTYPLIPLK